ncbi:hypothetical protein Q8F55_002769 [Vanrija albida]|uniref:Mid2 domain-containing protein n=1 Tax=Vanrija albida TaxID=181172 RepID=A0ABR3QBA3_9TREE
MRRLVLLLIALALALVARADISRNSSTSTSASTTADAGVGPSTIVSTNVAAGASTSNSTKLRAHRSRLAHRHHSPPETNLILATTLATTVTSPTSTPGLAAAPHPVPAGAIAGATVASALVLTALLLAAWYYARRRPPPEHTEKATLTSPSLEDAADPFACTPLGGRAISPPLPLQPRVHAASFSSIGAAIGVGHPPPPLGSWRPRTASGALAPPVVAPGRALGPVLQRA